MTKIDLLTPKEVAEAVGDIAPGTARQWMMSGKIAGAYPHGNTYIIERSALEEALARGIEKQAHVKPGNGSPWLTSYEVRAALAEAGHPMAHATVLDWLRKGLLPGERSGKAWAVPRAEFERMLAEGFVVPAQGRGGQTKIIKRMVDDAG